MKRNSAVQSCLSTHADHNAIWLLTFQHLQKYSTHKEDKHRHKVNLGASSSSCSIGNILSRLLTMRSNVLVMHSHYSYLLDIVGVDWQEEHFVCFMRALDVHVGLH